MRWAWLPACCGARRRWRSAAAGSTLLYQLAVSGVLLSVAATLSGAPLPGRLSLLAWSSLGFQVVIVSFASYLLWFWLMRHYPATRLAAFTLLTPVFGLLLGALLLGEPITPRLIVALVTVAGGIVLVNRSPQPRMRLTSDVVE
jgi:drug/metabolite transporter (DMT)-like permease